MLNNDVVTNLFFNAGYIYQDFASIYELLEQANYVGSNSANYTDIQK